MSQQTQHASPSSADRRSSGALILLVVGLVLVGVNLRPALSSLSPVLKQVAAGTGLSGATAGLLTTLPVLCLGLFAPAAAVLARRFGAERAVGSLLIALAAGIALPSRGPIWASARCVRAIWMALRRASPAPLTSMPTTR